MGRDWHDWHKAYDVDGSPLAQRLGFVQDAIRAVLDAAPPGPIRVVSMCAGEGRDLLGVLADHSRGDDVQGRLVELDPLLAAIAREHAPAAIEVLCADAGVTDAYAGAVPADLVLVCGVLGNIAQPDIEHTIQSLPMLCAPGATVIWTHHRRPPDRTPWIREEFEAVGFEELSLSIPEEFLFGVGAHRLVTTASAFQPGRRLFDFVGFDTLLKPDCERCNYTYSERDRTAVLVWFRSDVTAFADTFDANTTPRTRPAPDVWSPLEYACHVRDMLVVQRERVELALVEDCPTFVPMGRDERVVDDRYNEQDPATVSAEVRATGEALAATFDRLDDVGWARTGIYNYPEPTERTVEWIGVHTVHELLHHRDDIS